MVTYTTNNLIISILWNVCVHHCIFSFVIFMYLISGYFCLECLCLDIFVFVSGGI